MIPGTAAIGQYPNLSLGLPVARSGKNVTIRVFAKKLGLIRIQPLKIARLAKFPHNT